MDPELVIPLAAIGLPMLIAIIAILTKHQQKMAEIVRETGMANNQAIPRLEAEVQELRSMVMEQAVTIDNLSDANRRLRTEDTRRLTDQASI